jgi:hypothetical protein
MPFTGNLGLFHIHRMYTLVDQFRTQYVEPVRANVNRWFEMASPPPGMMQVPQFRAEDLGFLLDDPRHDSPAPQALSDFAYAQERLRIFVELADLRSAAIVSEAVPHIRSTGLPAGLRPPRLSHTPDRT